MIENPLARLGDLSKPATVLIEKISDAVGGVFRPYQTVRVARSEAEADRIRAESQVEVTDIQRRAMYRFFEEEGERQSNIEEITEKALPLLEEESSPQDVQDDWITNFFDKCRIISDADMQRLWANVLAGEANTPGAFSKRTVNLLSDLDNNDAELFMHFCGFVWTIDESVVPLVFDHKNEIYDPHRINFSSLLHLESLGLIQFNIASNFVLAELPKKATALYFGRQLELTFPEDAENEIDVGQVLLTRAGRELAAICGSPSVDGFYDFVYAKFSQQFLVPNI